VELVGRETQPRRPARCFESFEDLVSAPDRAREAQLQARLQASRSTFEHAHVRRPTEVAAGDPGRLVGVELLAAEDVDETATAQLVGMNADGAGLDELHRRPPLELSVAEAVDVHGAVR